jgi:hypothetical protein
MLLQKAAIPAGRKFLNQIFVYTNKTILSLGCEENI